MLWLARTKLRYPRNSRRVLGVFAKLKLGKIEELSFLKSRRQRANLLELVEDALAGAVEEKKLHHAVCFRNLHLLYSEVYPDCLRHNCRQDPRHGRRENT